MVGARVWSPRFRRPPLHAGGPGQSVARGVRLVLWAWLSMNGEYLLSYPHYASFATHDVKIPILHVKYADVPRYVLVHAVLLPACFACRACAVCHTHMGELLQLANLYILMSAKHAGTTTPR